MKKRILSLGLCVLLLCTVCLPFGVSAEEPVAHNHAYYVDYISRSADGSHVESFGLFCEDCEEVVHVKTNATVVDYTISYNGWGADGKNTWYFIDGLVTLKDPLRISGTVNLVLLDDSLFICESGIRVFDNGTLNIYSEHLDYTPDTADNHMGKLRAYARDTLNGYPAIGGMEHGTNATVNLYGGDVYALSEGFGAAIGTGWMGTATVNVFGGKVRALTTDCSAALGGGYEYTNATVNVHGGIVWAENNFQYAASVGCGFWECHATVNFTGGYLYGVPQKRNFNRVNGIVADSVTTTGDVHSLGKNDGFYDEAGMMLAEKAGWIAQNGGYAGTALSQGSLWILLAIAVAAVGGALLLLFIKKKKRSATKDDTNQ